MKKKIKGKKKTERRKKGMFMCMMFVLSELVCQYYDYKNDLTLYQYYAYPFHIASIDDFCIIQLL